MDAQRARPGAGRPAAPPAAAAAIRAAAWAAVIAVAGATAGRSPGAVGAARAATAAQPGARPAWATPVARLYFPILADDGPVGDVRGRSGWRLTEVVGDAWEPALAPAGDRLVYLWRPRAGEVALRTLRVAWAVDDGGGAAARGVDDRVVALGARFEDLDLPTFAPDGRNLVFAGRADGQWDVYRLPLAADGAPAAAPRLENLTRSPDADENRPALAPDGRLLAFDFHRGADADDIGWLDLATGARGRLTDDPAHDRMPTFAPDGRSLLFRAERTGRSQIHRVALEGGADERVSFYEANDGYATYAPDGRTILFESDRGGVNGLYLMDPTGRRRRALLAAANARFATPRFGPDGRTVVFSASFGDGDLAIHVLRLPGGDGPPPPAWHGGRRGLR